MTLMMEDIQTNCKKCGVSTPVEFQLTPELVHYGKVVCQKCGGLLYWVRNPDKKKKRIRTTKCKVDRDVPCAICKRRKELLGINETIEAHHIIALEDGGKDEPDNLIMLCTECHRMWTQRKRIGEHIIEKWKFLDISKKQVMEVLEANGFQRETANWQDYDRAKKLIIGGNIIESYEKVVRWISDYFSELSA